MTKEELQALWPAIGGKEVLIKVLRLYRGNTQIEPREAKIYTIMGGWLLTYGGVRWHCDNIVSIEVKNK